MISKYALIERFNACSEEVRLKPFRKERVIDPGVAASIGGWFGFDAVSRHMAVNEAPSNRIDAIPCGSNPMCSLKSPIRIISCPLLRRSETSVRRSSIRIFRGFGLDRPSSRNMLRCWV